MSDQREPRRPIACPVEGMMDGRPIVAHSADLCSGGAFLVGLCDVKEGDVLRLSFLLPNGRLEVSAQVRWVRKRAASPAEPLGCGVRFLDLTEEDRAGLAEAMELP